MRRWRRRMRVTLWAGILFSQVIAQPHDLRVRLGRQGTLEMRVTGIDEMGRIRMQPMAGDGGEAMIPWREARDLQFDLPADYGEAQKLAFDGHRGEAVLLLRRIVPALVPYAAVPGSNATGVVRFYFRLLVRERAWPDAIALAVQLPTGEGDADFMPDIVALARALQGAGRLSEVATVMERVVASSNRHRKLVGELAHDLRRGGHWREARGMYGKLQGAGDAIESERIRLLLAYTDWHLGSDSVALALLRTLDPPPVKTERGVLFRLLAGRTALAAGDSAAALDGLAEALVGIEVASEWRVEITAVIAQAYRAAGRDDVAELIETDLRRLHPGSRWVTLPLTP